MSIARKATVHVESYYESEVVQIAPIARVVRQPAQRVALTPLQKCGYGLLIATVALTGIQAVRCGVFSGVKLEGLLKQLSVVEQAQAEAKAQNALLQDRIERYSSNQGVEEMARERLSMVAQDEILVRVYPTSLASH